MKQNILFFREFLRSPGQTGAIAPSSPHLARAMVAGADLERAGLVLEIGVGTGAFTPTILAALGPSTRYLAVEKNGRLVELFRRAHPSSPGVGPEVVHADAAELPELTRELGPAVCVLSSLPWALFDPADQETLLAAIHSCLEAGGELRTFAYLQGLVLPSGRYLRDLLHRLFSTVERSPVVWRNLPPAVVYRCVK